MTKSQSNIIKLVAQTTQLSNLNLDQIIHPKRADDINFKSSLYDVINILRERGIDEKIPLESRFAIANLFHWLNKKKSVNRHLANEIFDQILPVFMDAKHVDHDNFTKLVSFFKPLSEEESFSVTIFPQIRAHLSVYDLVEVIRGLDSLFNSVIQRHFEPDSNFKLFKLNEFIELFSKKFAEEVKSKGEMSFMFDSGNDAVKLAISEVYRAFLQSIYPTFFSDFGLPTSVMTTMNLRLIVETNMNFAPELIEQTYKMLTSNEELVKIKKKLLEKIKGGNEDEVDEATDKMKKMLMSIIDKIELTLHIRQYNIRNHLESDNQLSALIFEKLKEFNKELHFTTYSINKLLEFKPNQIFTKNEINIYIREMSETTHLLKSEFVTCPDEEMRFFIDRVLKNTNDLSSYKEILSTFRSMIKDKDRNQIMHVMLQDCAMNNRHASALLSFFYSAKFEITYGEIISLVNIEEIANRLGATFSVTRRFKMAKFIEDTLNTGKIKNQTIEALQTSGLFALVVTNLMNQKELEYTFDQYVNPALFYSDYTDGKIRPEYIRKLVNEIDQKIKADINVKFADVLDGIDDQREKHEISQYGQTKVITLLTRELDSRRKDQTVKNVTREEMNELIDNYCFDARGQYESEKATRSINIADLYMLIQQHSMRVSVVLGDIRQNYNKEVEPLKNMDNFSDIERIPIILGGVAVAHREEDLNFEKKGLFNIIEEIKNTPKDFTQIIIASINKEHGNIEVKDEMGKTRKIFDDFFKGSNDLIKGFEDEKLGTLFTCVILMDLLREVSDALVSSRNMAKNSVDLKTALDDIFNRSKDLLSFSEREYNRIMGVKEQPVT